MLLFLLFFSSVLTISKDSIKRYMNLSIGLCIVYPDNMLFDIMKDRFFQALINSIQGPFTLSTYKYSEYSLSDKTMLSEHLTNIIITRDNKFLENYQGNFSLDSVSKEINEAYYSYVEILDESNISDFKKSSHSLFILTGPTILKEFEDAAFFYKNTKARFAFFYQNKTTDSFLSLFYIKNKQNVTRIYDRTVPIIQFIRSCKTENSIKPKNPNSIKPPKHSIQFVAISDELTDEIQSAFEYINNSNYGDSIDFDVVSWENSIELQKKCQIQKTNFFNLSFVIHSNYYKMKNNAHDNCFVFQDMDFYSKELLYFFISKTINFYIYNSNKNSTEKFENFSFKNSLPVVLSPSNFSRFIPGKNISFVFIECPNSFSNSRAKMIFHSIFQEFKEMQASKEKIFQPVQFYRIQYHYDNFRLPSADSFPTFVIFKPFNKQAIVFNQILSAKNLRNWIFSLASKSDITNNSPKPINNSPLLNSKNSSIKIESETKRKVFNRFLSSRNSIENLQKVPKRPKIINIDRKEINSEL